jgi:hypothetical protein
MKIVGVDPGAYGAIALLNGPALDVFDMPVVRVRRGKSDKAEVNVAELFNLFSTFGPCHAFIEQVGGMTGQSASAAFNFGRAAAAPECMAIACGMSVTRVPPVVWKRALRVLGGKDQAVSRASSLFPRHVSAWAAVRGNGAANQREGRAEAALIAEYGRRTLVGESVDVFG